MAYDSGGEIRLRPDLVEKAIKERLRMEGQLTSSRVAKMNGKDTAKKAERKRLTEDDGDARYFVDGGARYTGFVDKRVVEQKAEAAGNGTALPWRERSITQRLAF